MKEPGPAPQGEQEVQRDLVIDLVRFVCLALVVVGHCMMVSPVLQTDGTVTSENTLGDQPWFVPVIWIFMVMPLFFVTGGTTGLRSWQRLKARGGTGVEFAQARLLRLVRPAAALLAVMFLGLSAALLFGVDAQVVQLMATGAGMPLWFLAAYLAAQLNIPLLARFHSRAPWLTVAVLAALVIAVDCFRGALPMLAYANLVFLWCAVQQLGFLVADGHLASLTRSGLVGLILAANLLLGLVTGLGLYSGNMLVNLNPPNLCLLLLGVSQAGALQLFRPGLGWVSGVRWVRAVVMVAGRRSMTVYLWHLPLLVAMSGLLLLTDFPKPAAGTAEWWWARPLVLLGVVALLLPVLAAFGHLEERPTASVHTRGRPAVAVVTAAVVVFIPVGNAALNGLTLGLLGGGAACFVLAMLLLGRMPVRVPGDVRAERAAHNGRQPGEPLPAGPSSANVEP
ncbi:acyltransferase [Pseudarthrobacter sp. AL07]|uniref:acyltransferase family protein n=1 Tax=unclassified Pseudarthrobacter TaxID=2647000 RepID=UPI002499F370|nr:MULTISPECIES: acyltransferase [unclassified Pseudarthrobacter]MDI3193998.1 acyltransferase [Pseudarthrobacter sp. AL20]MDI3208041.1 acyltransferase [Pseudarthrobacter sp. AL07]